MPVFTTLPAGLILYWGLSWGARQSLFEWGAFFAIDSQARLEDAFLINSSLAFWFILKIILFVGTPLLIVVIATPGDTVVFERYCMVYHPRANKNLKTHIN